MIYNPPRIAFTGASATGKTSLAIWLAQHLGVPFNPYGSRSAAASMGFVDDEGKPKPYNVDRADLAVYEAVVGGDRSPENLQRAARAAVLEGVRGKSCRSLFQEELLRQKTDWEAEHVRTGFVTDRTTCDNLAYSTLHDVYGVSKSYLDSAMAHMIVYDLVFFTPVDVFQKIGGDGARVEDEHYHRLFEMMLEGATQEALLSDGRSYSDIVWHLSMETLEDRKDYIEKLCRNPHRGYLWNP